MTTLTSRIRRKLVSSQIFLSRIEVESVTRTMHDSHKNTQNVRWRHRVDSLILLLHSTKKIVQIDWMSAGVYFSPYNNHGRVRAWRATANSPFESSHSQFGASPQSSLYWILPWSDMVPSYRGRTLTLPYRQRDILVSAVPSPDRFQRIVFGEYEGPRWKPQNFTIHFCGVTNENTDDVFIEQYSVTTNRVWNSRKK